MRSRFLAGMVYSTFRRGRTSVQTDRHISSIQRSWLSNCSEKAALGAVTQRMQYADTYDKKEDLVCPIKYFKEEVQFLRSLDGNELLKTVGKKGRTEVSLKVGRAVRSLAEIILENHALGIPLSESLKLSNLRISSSLGRFAMMEPPKRTTTWGNLLGDFGRGADLLEELAREVLGPDAQMPSLWIDYIAKMREEFPRVELLVYHTFFLPMNLRYMLLVIIDQRFRKDFDSLEKMQKNAIRKFLKQLGEKRKDNMALLLHKNEFLKFVSLKSRRGSKGRRGKPNSVLSTADAIWSEKAHDIISINRDGVVHGCKSDVNDAEKKAMPSIRNHWRTRENVIELLGVEFDLLEQDYIDL